MHGFDTGDEDSGTAKVFESEHGARNGSVALGNFKGKNSMESTLFVDEKSLMRQNR